MTMHKLERLLRPKSIAVFGGAQAAAVVAQSIKMGFAGEIWPVHPTKDEVAGRKAYRSVAELPGAPDAAFVGVNRHLTIEVIKALAERGAGGAVCAMLISGGSTNATKRRVTFASQPTVTLTVTTGSSINALVVMRTVRSPPFCPSMPTRTCPAPSRFSPDCTSAETHSTGSASSGSSRTTALKFSGWPSWVVLLMRPNPMACADDAASHSAVPIAVRVETARMRDRRWMKRAVWGRGTLA